MSKFPLNLQFFADGDGGAANAAAAATTPVGTQPANQSAASPKPATAEDIAAAVLKAVGERTTRAENGVVKSMATEYGMTEEQLKAVLDKHKAEQAAKLPADAQKQIDDAKAELQKYKLSAEIAKEGAALGLLDADIALTLLPADATKPNDKGEFSGLKAALEKLKTDKPYLFGAMPKPTATAQRVSGAPAPNEKTPEDEIRERMFKK